VDAPTFLHHLRRSNLLSAEEVEQVAQRLNQEQLRRVAVDLVAQGHLTRFQAKQLLAGRHRGFVLGQYRLLDQLGIGAMGIVYKALHTAMNRLVALKVFKPVVSSDDNWHESMFQREARAVGELNHPNIVAIYDAAKVGNVRFLAMEYVNGRTLKRLVRKKGPLPVGLACELMRQAAQGLQYAHERGVVHRDVKPSNMLVVNPPKWRETAEASAAPRQRGPCTLKISDFGLARLQKKTIFQSHQEATIQALPGVVWGTLDFISPEQLADVHSADIRSDLYSLGCTLYYALTGHPPLPGATPIQKLIKRATQAPEPLASERPDVPPELSRIVERLMAPDPASRFQSPRELSVELRPWCNLDDLHSAGSTHEAPSPELELPSVSTLENISHAMRTTQDQPPLTKVEEPETEERGSLSFTEFATNEPIVLRAGQPQINSQLSKKRLFWIVLGSCAGILVLIFLVLLAKL
jgi:serine/threonine-protein kinase